MVIIDQMKNHPFRQVVVLHSQGVNSATILGRFLDVFGCTKNGKVPF